MLKSLIARLSGGGRSDAAPAAPARTPFRLAAGGAFVVSPSGRARLDGLGVPTPDGLFWIREHGLTRDAGHAVHRFYADPDPARPDADWILQAVQDPDGALVPGETILWRVDQRIFPASHDDWLTWLDSRDGESGLIGWPLFECAATGAIYERVEDFVPTYRHAVAFEDGVREVSAPRVMEEALHAADGGRRRARLERTMYARPLAEGADADAELCMLEAVDLGDAGAWVRILKGVDLNAEEIALP